MAELNHERYGSTDGPRMLTIHGITSHAKRFEHLGTGPWAHRSVLSVDLRGHGYSLDDAPWSFEQHVEDLIDTLDSVGWTEPVDVVGHSMGGAIATFMLALAPGRIRRVVLLDPSLHRDGAATHEAARGALTGNSYASIEEMAAERANTLGESGHWAISAELAAHTFEGPDGRYHYRYRTAPIIAGWGEMARVTPVLSQRRPTLVVVATKVDICTPVYVEALRAQLGAALSVEPLDCGHMVYWERPDDTARLVDDFLG